MHTVIQYTYYCSTMSPASACNMTAQLEYRCFWMWRNLTI